MRRGKRAVLVFLCLILSSCSEPVDTKMSVEIPGNENYIPDCKYDPRVSITRIGVIEDRIAYDQRRGIYIIKDNETKKEYIGVSGVGICERGAHSSGKTSMPDER